MAEAAGKMQTMTIQSTLVRGENGERKCFMLLAGWRASTPVVDAPVCLQPAQLIKGSLRRRGGRREEARSGPICIHAICTLTSGGLCPPIPTASPSKMFWTANDKEGGLNKNSLMLLKLDLEKRTGQHTQEKCWLVLRHQELS